METLQIHPAGPCRTMPAAAPRVYVQGQRRRELAVRAWELLPAPQFERVELELLTDAGGQVPRLESLRALPPIGTPLTVAANDDAVTFRGIVASHATEASPDGERLTALAVHELTDLLRAVISDFTQRGAGGELVTLPAASVCFNGADNGLCGEQPVAVGQRAALVFSAESSAKSWTVAGALSYLLALHVPPSVEVQGLDQLLALAGYIDLGVLNVTGLTVVEAMVRVAGRGGLALRAARDGLGLVFYRPGAEGRQSRVRLQEAGETLSTDQTNLSAAAVSIGRRPWRKGVLAMGEAKRYEATFLLHRGWDRSLETPR